MPKQMKVLHAQYKFNTNVSRGGNEEDYVVVYLENNATDVMMQGYTQVPKEQNSILLFGIVIFLTKMVLVP